jgi:hypothetical protein
LRIGVVFGGVVWYLEKTMKSRFVILSLICLLAGIGNAGADFARYQVILDRMPFGVEPTPESLAAAAARAAAPQELFTRNLKMCAVTRNLLTGDLQVGLTDAVTKKNYFLKVGESEDGITVLQADYDGERALLKKDEQEVWLGMNDAVAMKTVASGALPARTVSSRVAAGGGRVQPRQAIREIKVVPPKYAGEELTKHLENYQMELIRAGGEKGPPLPMELTPEMDKQLVEEGVLPPME